MSTATPDPQAAARYRATVVKTTGFFHVIRKQVTGEFQYILNYLLPPHTSMLDVGRLIEMLGLKLKKYLPDPATPVYHYEFSAQRDYVRLTVSSTEYGLIVLQAAKDEPKSLLKLSLHTIATTIRSMDGLVDLQRLMPNTLMQKIATTYYGLLEYRPRRNRMGSGLSLRPPPPCLAQ